MQVCVPCVVRHVLPLSQRLGATHTVRSRGGDGFAFVVHNDNAVSMGQPASGMGFVGIRNGIAIEFDTFYNPEQMDPWENHVAVVTRGWRDPLSSNHSYELGHATA